MVRFCDLSRKWGPKVTNYVILSHRDWNKNLAQQLAERLGRPFHLINSRDDLTVDRLRAIAPRYVFVAHWSFRIPEEIFNEFECIIFHMTDVPYGRGGSPLQNLILRGHDSTMISGLRCVSEMDAGPVYIKSPLALNGSAEEIYVRANNVIATMICDIVRDEPTPVPQVGEVTPFVRRRPEDSELPANLSPQQTYDFIRMLDAPDYPRAFLRYGNFRLEFSKAELSGETVIATVELRSAEDITP